MPTCRLRLRLRESNAALQESNARYQMLTVESNHRIKNNLQMVISMLQYSSGSEAASTSQAMERMAAKIHSVSALHKHLSMDGHNELVRLDAYFGEIVALHKDIALEGTHIDAQVPALELRSGRLVYFGLVLNELLGASLDQRAGARTVHVIVAPHATGFSFSFEDPAGHASENMLVPQLIARVGGTDLHYHWEAGSCTFYFNTATAS